MLIPAAFAVLLAAPEFYRDVLPVLTQRCVSCHRAGEVAPMPLTTYAEVRPWASAIRESVRLKKMPPWFAHPASSLRFGNDPSLSEAEISTLMGWIEAGAPEGPRPRNTRLGGRVSQPSRAFSPDLTLAMPQAFRVPANATIAYQHFVLKLPFTYDRWVRAVEVRPSNRAVVHHAVAYIRPPESKWLRSATEPAGPTTDDILAVYTPGSRALVLPLGMAKKIPAGADIVLQVHYTSGKQEAEDRISIDLGLLSEPPQKRVLTLQMGRDDLRIPAGSADYKASVSGSLPRDAVLLSLTPHMHLRGAQFDFEAFPPGRPGAGELLLRVKPFDFFWQLTYTLETPRVLPKGTVLKWTGSFDNSRNNPRNPDPEAEVTWGEQSWQEMMIGFFDVAVEPSMDKMAFFARD